MIEVLKARDYYGRHAVGIVVLVNGHPVHFTGARSRAEASVFVKELK